MESLSKLKGTMKHTINYAHDLTPQEREDCKNRWEQYAAGELTTSSPLKKCTYV